MQAVGNNSEVRHWATAEGLGLPAASGLPLRPRRRADTDCAAARSRLEGDIRSLPASTQRPEAERFVPFDAALDDRYVDGRPRCDGVREFLAARRIEVDAATVTMLGDRKNDLILSLIRRQALKPYEDSASTCEPSLLRGLRRAVVSASANCRTALEATGLTDLFEVRIDAARAAEEHLQGKPAPDTFLAAAQALDVEPAEAAVFEDALAGVAAGRAGHFGFVVEVNRTGRAEALRRAGADRSSPTSASCWRSR